MSTILFKLAGRLERKWLLTKTSQIIPEGTDNHRKFNLALNELNNIVNIINKPLYGAAPYNTKDFIDNKNVINKLLSTLAGQVKLNKPSGNANPDITYRFDANWLYNVAARAFKSTMPTIDLLVSSIEKSYHDSRLLNELVVKDIENLKMHIFNINANILSMNAPTVTK